MKDMLLNVGSGGGAAAAAPSGGAGAAAGSGDAKEEKEEAKKEEGMYPASKPINVHLLTSYSTEKEESDDDMGFGLFD